VNNLPAIYYLTSAPQATSCITKNLITKASQYWFPYCL